MNNCGRIYLDNNATTAIDPEVLRVVADAASLGPLNPSSSHRHGLKARAMFEDAREQMGMLVGASGERIVVTSGGTESNNLAIFGTAAMSAPGRRHLVVSAIEHSSVLASCARLEAAGWTVDRVLPRGGGAVDAEAVTDRLTTDTALVSVMLVNNETGVIQPVREIALAARAKGVRVHVDAVQAVGRIDVGVRELGADLVSVSGHKIYGPPGTGFLYVGRGIRLESILCGGGQQNGFRPGTQNVPGAVGLGVACGLAAQRMVRDSADIAAMRNRFEEMVLERISDAWINGASSARVCGTSSLGIRGVDSGEMLAALDMEGISVSSGSACSALGSGPSHVLLAMGLSPVDAMSTIRVSFGRHNQPSDVDASVEALVRVVSRLRSG